MKTETNVNRFSSIEAERAHLRSFKRGERVLTYDYETDSWDDIDVVVEVNDSFVTTNWINYPRGGGHATWTADHIRHI